MPSAATLAYQRTRTYRRARWRVLWRTVANVAVLLSFGVFLALLIHLGSL